MADPKAEAQLYLEWMRGAAGRFLPADRPRSVATSATDRASRQARLDAMAREVAACERCGLCASRSRTVFGEGSPAPRLVAVGEAPGADEDRTGRPFVGRAGALLTRMLEAIGLSREEVFICNVLKCRPPENRAPRPDEVAACRPYLQAQLEVLEAPLLLALGGHAARLLLRTARGITALRGRVVTSPDGWRVMPTYHPAYLLRNPGAKREAWDDLRTVAAELGLEIPSR